MEVSFCHGRNKMIAKMKVKAIVIELIKIEVPFLQYYNFLKMVFLKNAYKYF
jgi:hypothetical protein